MTLEDRLLPPVLASLPRALGLEDRDAASPTFGCFDRNFWHYRVADFPSSWFAVGAHLLAHAATRAVTGNPFAGRERTREWALGAVSYHVRQAHRDGSLAEVYPFERSYCSTSFAALHVGLALHLLQAPAPEDLARIGRWLASAPPTDAANQVAAAAAALAVLEPLVGDPALGRASDACVQHLLAQQDAAGAFPEYGGFDLGYQTVTLSCLAHRVRHRPSEALEKAARRGAALVAEQVRADGTYDWRKGSRRTQFLYPSGLRAFGSEELLARVDAGLAAGKVMTPLWMDDRYFMHLAVDFWVAALVR
jgi:hypothetical protein